MKIIVSILLLFSLFVGASSTYGMPQHQFPPQLQHRVLSDTQPVFHSKSSIPDSTETAKRIHAEILRVKAVLKTKRSQYDDQLLFCCDMRIPSNYYRFFVVDLKNERILKSGLVAHGSGSETGYADSLIFSNVPESYKTSLGVYSIGNSYEGSFGLSFKLNGLEKTNSNAYKRLIVLHRYFCVPSEEQAEPICTSLGCAMVAEPFMDELTTIIRSRSKPILLSIYY